MASDILAESDPPSQTAQGRREAEPATGSSPANSADPRERLIALVRSASVETSARDAGDAAGHGGLLPPGTAVYIAWIPGSAPERTAEVAVRLAALAYRPVPHIAARELASETDAGALIGRLREQAGAEEMLLIAGDRAVPRGPFADSVALLRTGFFAAHGITRLGVAAYPEGHAKMDRERWADVLREKQALARSQGIELTLVTQFSFDGAAILDWLRRLRGEGILTPVRIGMAGPAKVTTLIKYGMRCGVGNSLRFLTARPSHVAGLLAAHGPEDALLAIAKAEPGLGIAGVHFFTFGGFARTARWATRVAAGRFELDAGGALRVGAE